MWSSGIDTKKGYRYSLGWFIEGDDSEGADVPLVAYHAGGAIGASSVLVIVPGPVSENGMSSLIAMHELQRKFICFGGLDLLLCVLMI